MSTPPDDFKWIGKFLKRYIATIGPHDWPDDPDDMRCFAEGWVGAFKLAHPSITEAEADAARVRLALHPPAFKRDHLPAVVAVVLGMREKAAAEQFHRAMSMPAEQVEAILASQGCPECSTATGPTGWARRKGVWSDLSWSMSVTLYCRCPLGRYRVGRNPMHPPLFDDLQAFPNLWDPARSHPSWSPRPVDPPSVEGREWRFLAPGEPVPPPLAEKAARDVAMPSRKRRPDWAGNVPVDLPMPKPPRRPAPRPEPTPEPVAEMTEEDFSWM